MEMKYGPRSLSGRRVTNKGVEAMYDSPYINMDSFGDYLPVNWKQIADSLNEIIDTMEVFDDYGQVTTEGRETIDNLWEQYCDGSLDNVPEPIWG